MHCIAPRYLDNQIERSRRNLGLETIDLFYLHNPESQLADVSQAVFHERLEQAFALLESSVKAGKLRYYGVATWNAFRVPGGSRDYISLPTLPSLHEKSAARRITSDSSSFPSTSPCRRPSGSRIRRWRKRTCPF